MKIIWTEKTEKQLDQIFEYIAAESSLFAHRTVGQIIEEAESISHHPRAGYTPNRQAFENRNLINR